MDRQLLASAPYRGAGHRREIVRPSVNETSFPDPVREGLDDPELPTVQAQLMVFARELGQLYHLERARSTELRRALENLQETYFATM